MTEERIKQIKAEIAEKVKNGILPEGAEMAICVDPNCPHYLHRAMPQKPTEKSLGAI